MSDDRNSLLLNAARGRDSSGINMDEVRHAAVEDLWDYILYQVSDPAMMYNHEANCRREFDEKIANLLKAYKP